jgi:hypothetical protein
MDSLAGLLDLEVRPTEPTAAALAELACQSGARLGNSLADNSINHTDGEMLMN